MLNVQSENYKILLHHLGYWGFNFYMLYIIHLRFKCLNSSSKGHPYAYFATIKRATYIHNKPSFFNKKNGGLRVINIIIIIQLQYHMKMPKFLMKLLQKIQLILPWIRDLLQDLRMRRDLSWLVSENQKAVLGLEYGLFFKLIYIKKISSFWKIFRFFLMEGVI